MMKSLMLASAMIVAAPALAQTADTSRNPNAATPATPAQPATPAAAGQAAEPATPAEPAQPSGQAQAAPNAADAVAQVVAADWNTYDADKNGALSKDEFAKWMIALREKSPQQQPVADISAWTNAAFAQADKDKSSSVTQTELQSFLRG